MYQCSLERMKEKLETFARFGDTGNGGITRYSLSEEAIMARNEFIKRMEAIGAVIEKDDMANVYATISGSDPHAKRIVMGSHADSVMNGGNYDGILGVISAMEVLETVVTEAIPHKHPLTAMIWTNEEGALYPPAMMSSGVVCYKFLPENIKANFEYEDMMNSKNVLDGKTTFEEALMRSGFRGRIENRLSRENAKCMFETHIEQGPILEAAGKNIGIVKCVLGMFNYRIRFYGQTSHAGTFPMNKRKDALYAAAEAICYIHEEIDKLGIAELVYTTGEIVCHPNIHTCVPDFVDISIDVRHEDTEALKRVEKVVMGLEKLSFAGCKCKTELQWKRDTVYWDKELVGYVEESAKEAGANYKCIHSGAGHDAQFVSYMIPTTMIFVKSKEGLSHCEKEYSEPEDCTMGATIMLNAVLRADKKE